MERSGTFQTSKVPSGFIKDDNGKARNSMKGFIGKAPISSPFSSEPFELRTRCLDVGTGTPWIPVLTLGSGEVVPHRRIFQLFDLSSKR